MIVTAPWGLIALAAIPAIVAIHLFRRKFPPRTVAGLFLWEIARRTPEGGGKITKLPITASLLLECLAALALALILAGLRLSPAGLSQHLVVLLDDSASMTAVDAQGESARDRAVRRVLTEARRLPSGGRITIVESGDRPAILAGPAALAIEADAALAAWRPEAQHHSLAMGLRVARELAGRTGQLLVVSNVAPDARGEAHFDDGVWAAVGAPAANVGITAALRTAASDGKSGAVSLTLLNNAAAPARRRLTVSAGEAVVVAREVDVPPGVSSVTLPIPAGLPAVRVELSVDAFSRDNGVMLAEPKPQIVGVENHLPDGRGRTALVKALDALSGVAVAAAGHLAFVDGGELDRSSSTDVWRVGFGRVPPAWQSGADPRDFIGPFVLEKRHPLLLGLTLDGVVWTGARPLTPGVVHPLVSAGDQVLAGITASTPATGSGTTVLFNLDLDRTNLLRSPDWPILISNVVEMRRQSLPGPERWNYRSGEWVRVRLDRDPKGPLRYRCGAAERALPAGRQLEFLAPSPGGLLQILEGDQVLFEIGVNFLDEAESSLRDQSTASVGTFNEVPGLRAENGAASDPLFWLLAAIAAAAALVNWALLAPARTRPVRGLRAGA